MKLQRYDVKEVIGKGGNSIVYRAVDKSLHIEVAIKCISNPSLEVQKEAHYMAKLVHPAIPRIYDIFEEQQMFCIVMEYLEGTSLMEYMQKHESISQKQLLDWLRQVKDVLLYLHHQQLLYIDLKPQNLMRTKDNKIYMLDFGSITPIGERVQSATKGYAPKEVMLEKRGVIQSDVYAFGRCFYVLYHGSFPHAKVKAKDAMDRFLLMCCQENIEKRYADFTAVGNALYFLEKRYRKQIIWLIIYALIACLCIVLMFVSIKQMEVARQKAYVNAMRKEQYEEAIAYQPFKVTPYEKLMDQVCKSKLACQEGYLLVEELAQEKEAYKQSDIAFYLAMQSMLIKWEDSVEKAHYYFQYVDEVKKDEKEVIRTMKNILELLQKNTHGNALFVQLQQAEKHCQRLENVKLRFAYQKLLVSLYQQERLYQDAPQKVLALCALMRQELKQNEELISWRELEFLNESEAFAWYEIGYRAYEQGNYVEMKDAYAKSISFMKQLERKDRYQRISDMLYNAFYYGVQDDEKHAQLLLLKEAYRYAQRIEGKQERDYFMHKIEREMQFWQ